MLKNPKFSIECITESSTSNNSLNSRFSNNGWVVPGGYFGLSDNVTTSGTMSPMKSTKATIIKTQDFDTGVDRYFVTPMESRHDFFRIMPFIIKHFTWGGQFDLDKEPLGTMPENDAEDWFYYKALDKDMNSFLSNFVGFSVCFSCLGLYHTEDIPKFDDFSKYKTPTSGVWHFGSISSEFQFEYKGIILNQYELVNLACLCNRCLHLVHSVMLNAMTSSPYTNKYPMTNMP